jgi:hypothetical protein
LLAVKTLLSLFEKLYIRFTLHNVMGMPKKSMCAGDSFPGVRGCRGREDIYVYVTDAVISIMVKRHNFSKGGSVSCSSDKHMKRTILFSYLFILLTQLSVWNCMEFTIL